MSSSLNDCGSGNQGISHRLFTLCELLQGYSTADLISHCPECNLFYITCCQHKNIIQSDRKPCHHFRLVFTDGASFNNGRDGPQTGIGGAMGSEENSGVQQWSVPIDEAIDPLPDVKRTSQRAELLAALEGLRRLSGLDEVCHTKYRMKHEAMLQKETKQWIIATDSEYVVKGMTELLPGWKDSIHFRPLAKMNGWKNSKGSRPANFDLFQALDTAVQLEEQKQPVCVGFWLIPRQNNVVANRLAKRAAQATRPVVS